jgi:hypothetical protein
LQASGVDWNHALFPQEQKMISPKRIRLASRDRQHRRIRDVVAVPSIIPLHTKSKVLPRLPVARGIHGALALLCLLALAYYAASTSWAVWHHGFTEMFADQFQLYAKLLNQPFPENVLSTDNEHRHVLSHLGRLVELRFGQGGQEISIGVNLVMMWALASALALWIALDRQLPSTLRWAMVLAAALAIFWRGSARTQFHGNEGLQVYLVILCAMVAVHCAESMRAQARWRFVLVAWLASVAATFSFATGVAVFAVMSAMVVLRRVQFRWVTITLAGAVLALYTYMFVMPGAQSVRASLNFDPLVQLSHANTWLASFWTTAWLSYADSGNAGVDATSMAGIAPPLGAALVQSAQSVFEFTGQPSLLRLAAFIGGGGVLLFLLLAWRAWRDPNSVSRSEALGLGLAGFALTVALLVALGRNWLFVASPEQLLADRYVIWTNLFWFGLAIAAGARWARQAYASAAFALATLAVALMLYPSHQVGSGWAQSAERGVELRAAQIAAGVMVHGIGEHAAIGERALMLSVFETLRKHRIGMFRHPRQRLIGETLKLPSAPELPRVHLSILERVVDDPPGAMSGWHIEGRLSDPQLRNKIDGLLVADPAGHVVGLGEFSFSWMTAGWQRIDRIAEGFDVYIRNDPDCSRLQLYGVDAEATHFVALGAIPDCAGALAL